MSQTFILPHGKAALLAHLERLPNTRKFRVEVSEYTKKRSDSQNRYLWGVAYTALEAATGQPKGDWHDYFLGEYFGWERYELFGKPKIRPLKRSSKLSTTEFMDFVEFIQMRAAEHNIYIADPE